MPKEVTHMLLAEKTLAYFGSCGDKGQDIANLLQSNKEAFLLGAASPDIFFYDIPLVWEKKGGLRGSKWGDALHGTEGQHTMACVYAMAEILRKGELESQLGHILTQRQKDMLLAFAMGYLTHVALDTLLHPPVYYFAGNYYDSNRKLKKESETRHRVLESLLDLWLLEQEGLSLRDYAFPRKVRLSSKSFRLVVFFYTLALRLAYGDKNEPQETKFFHPYRHSLKKDPLSAVVRRSFRKQYIFNQFFQNSVVARLCFWVNRHQRDAWGEYTALYYPCSRYTDYLKYWPNALDITKLCYYRDPVSNQRRSLVVQSLSKRVLARSCRYVRALYWHWRGEKANRVKRILSGPSLNNGRVGISNSSMRYFDPLPLNGNFELLAI